MHIELGDKCHELYTWRSAHPNWATSATNYILARSAHPNWARSATNYILQWIKSEFSKFKFGFEWKKKIGFGSSILLILLNSEKKLVPNLSETKFLSEKNWFFWFLSDKKEVFPHSKPKKFGFEWGFFFVGFLNNSDNQ